MIDKRECMIWCDNGETWLQAHSEGRVVLSYVGILTLCSVEQFCHEKDLQLKVFRQHRVHVPALESEAA